MDAGKVRTATGWRDVQVAAFAKWPRGQPATAAHGDDRLLPAVTARRVVAAIEGAGAFGTRCGQLAPRLGLTDPQAVDVLGDGAE